MMIGQLAEASGASVRSVRHYEAAGLVTAKRLANGYRDFDSAAVTIVQQIGLLLQLGFPIKAIQELAPCLPESTEAIAVCPKIRSALLRHRAKLKSRHSALTNLLRKIDALIQGSRD